MKATVAVILLFVCVCQGKDATRVLLTEAAKQGAVCLDGSPPAYYIRPGYGNGTDKWIIHLEGGGWCGNESDCYERSKTPLGSSKNWPPSKALNGFLSDDSTVNPDFYNWNIIHVMYCDGGSFAGNLEKPIRYNNTPIYIRGQAILLASLDDLSEKGLRSASEVILTGCSAGGLATYLHADYVRAYLPEDTRFHSLADAGYILDIPTVTGEWAFRDGIKYGFKMQNASGGVNQDCLKAYSEDDAWKCFFAPYSYQYIKSPIFVMNSDYDTAQLAGILKLDCLPPNCTEEQMKFFNNFRTEFLDQAKPAIESHSNGIFIDSCLIHCQTTTDKPWTTFEIEGKKPMREAFSDWYYGRSITKEVDCAYPCNPTCKGVYREEEHVGFPNMFN